VVPKIYFRPFQEALVASGPLDRQSLAVVVVANLSSPAFLSSVALMTYSQEAVAVVLVALRICFPRCQEASSPVTVTSFQEDFPVLVVLTTWAPSLQVVVRT